MRHAAARWLREAPVSGAPRLVVDAIDCFERPVRYRLPFRFGAATVTEGVQGFVRVRIRFADGRVAHGASAELMVPKWFDKNPALSNAETVDELRDSLDLARSVYLADARPRTAFAHAAEHASACMLEGERRGLPALASAFGAAEIDKAIADALCRALRVSFYDAVRRDAIGFEPSRVAAELAHVDAPAFLRALAPRASLMVRHTVGMADALETAATRVDDGLPETLTEVIERDRVRWFKLKLAGDVDRDLDRLRAIAAVLARVPQHRVTLDGNEQFASIDDVLELVRRMRDDRALAPLLERTAFIEQPLPRQRTFEASVGAVAAHVALLIDEADATLDAFVRARGAGYTGVSVKSCKGMYKSLVNALRCAVWNGANERRFFLSGEDLTTPPGLAIEQDLALAALLGIEHVERNGHHYIDAAKSFPASEHDALAAAHPNLYERLEHGVRLRIVDGALDVASLAATGFAGSPEPDWHALAPMSRARAIERSAKPIATAFQPSSPVAEPHHDR